MKKIIPAALAFAAVVLSGCHDGTPRANFKTDVDTLSYELGVNMSATPQEFENYLKQMNSDSAYVSEFLQGFTEGIKSGDDKKKLAYYMGIQAGLNIRQQMPAMEAQLFQGDSTKKISVKNFTAGFTGFARGKSSLKIDGQPLDKEQAQKQIMEYMFGKLKKESQQFMAAKAAETGVKKLAGGVLYKELAPGTGTGHVSATDSVVIKYEGTLPNGTVFDTSERQANGTVTLSLKNVIKGWQIAIPHMPIGSTWEIYIPYDQAYGEQGSGPIPPFSALIFKVTLVGLAK